MRESGVFQSCICIQFYRAFSTQIDQQFQVPTWRCWQMHKLHYLIWRNLVFIFSALFSLIKQVAIFRESSLKAVKYAMRSNIGLLFINWRKYSLSYFCHLKYFLMYRILWFRSSFFDKLSISLSFYIQFHKSLRRMPDHTVYFVN